MSKWIVAALLAAVSLPGLAQAVVSEPEFSEVFFGLDSGKLLPLERQMATIQAGGGGFMVASSKASYVVTGNRSSSRFHSGTQLDFVVRSALASTSVDPSTIYILRKLDSKKKTREILFSSGHFSPLGGSMNTNLSQGTLPVAFAHYGAGSLKLTAVNLAPGEYALSRVYGQDLFCFGVD